MPQAREQVVSSLRFLRKNPNVPEKGMMYIAKKLQEAEEEPGEARKLLGSAYYHLRKRSGLKENHPLMRNIRRLNKAVPR